MNRQQRHGASKRRRPEPVTRPFRASLVPGTAWWWAPIAGMAAVKDAWQPFDAALKIMSGHSLIFPTGWAASIVMHWLLVGREVEDQKRAARETRSIKPGRN